MQHFHVSELSHVTPLAGVWIEITDRNWGFLPASVTPLAGVWIEIFVDSVFADVLEVVTPLAGVWIEIRNNGGIKKAGNCHSPCGSVD